MQELVLGLDVRSGGSDCDIRSLQNADRARKAENGSDLTGQRCRAGRSDLASNASTISTRSVISQAAGRRDPIAAAPDYSAHGARCEGCRPLSGLGKIAAHKLCDVLAPLHPSVSHLFFVVVSVIDPERMV